MVSTALRSGCLGACVALLFAAGCGSDNPKPADAGPDVLAPVTLSHDQLLEACVRTYACDVGRKPRLANCASDYYESLALRGQRVLYERIYDCVNKGSGDCKIIRECAGYQGRPKICDKDTHVANCKGDVAVNCDLQNRDQGWEWGLDCAKGGLKCAVQTGGTGAVAICGGGPCDPKTSQPTCRDKKQYKCSGGAIEVLDCPERGMQCRDPQVDGCEGSGRSCPLVQPSCKKTVRSECKQGYLWEVDCATAPGKKTCDQSLLACRGTGTECDQDGFFDACEGDTLVVCIDGYKRRYDCKAMGFLGCDLAGTGKYGAYCRAEPIYE
jgi:hypothetical protein